MPVQLAQRLITVEEYLKMAGAGILTEEDRVELIRGQIIKMSPIGSRHAACVDKIVALFHRLLASEDLIIRGQNPVQLDDYSEPEPDIAVLKPHPDYYAEQHPQAKDVLLIVEVADTSYDYDKEVKASLYAAADIPEYWIVNLEKREIEAHRDPAGSLYKHIEIFLPGDLVESKFLDLSAPADGLLV